MTHHPILAPDLLERLRRAKGGLKSFLKRESEEAIQRSVEWARDVLETLEALEASCPSEKACSPESLKIRWTYTGTDVNTDATASVGEFDMVIHSDSSNDRWSVVDSATNKVIGFREWDRFEALQNLATECLIKHLATRETDLAEEKIATAFPWIWSEDGLYAEFRHQDYTATLMTHNLVDPPSDSLRVVAVVARIYDSRGVKWWISRTRMADALRATEEELAKLLAGQKP